MSTSDKPTIKSLAALSKEEEQYRSNNTPPRKKQMSLASRVALFFIFPSFVGSSGVLFSYLQIKFPDESETANSNSNSNSNNNNNNTPKEINFDRDFIYPFLMALALVVVVAIQTGGFSSYVAAPLVSWPQVVKKVTVVRKKVYLDDDGNEVDEATALKELEKRKGRRKDD